ncbi:hypothetical protein [Aliiglaciecola sp. LCG003]|uniref:hypothetical protein n=1 Tax=Aliiglaciecola sp. LCG003 TaxID=3053655 RepID=UPI002572DFD7|nr:hypothetical protein [Aliiglaciecola sp. LCG003]WJG08628.1 hypothetical protein QR722_14965 [Aliiglaciecola sp. LCG003]
MKTLFNPRRTLIQAAVTLMFSALTLGSSYAKTNLNDLGNELEIMTNILKTSMRQDSKDAGFKVRSLNVMYLANQGVVFEVATSSKQRNFIFEFNGDSEFFVSPPEAPEAPHFDAHGAVDFEVETEQWGEEFAQVFEQVQESIERSSHMMREIKQQEREFAWDLRESERRLRDLEFEIRAADSARQKELNAEKKDLEDKIKQLKYKQIEVGKYATKIEQEHKQKAAEKLAARKQQYAAFIGKFEDNVSSTLCKYGTGIKALPESEHVSFVLNNMGMPERGGQQDKIYVFKNKDIQSCVRDKLSPKELIQKAESYIF